MKRIIPGLTLAMLAAGGTFLAATVAAAEPESKPCCFSNPRYSGQCKVAPGPDEKCTDILAYLNSQNSVGKAYCGNTTIRGGWASIACEDLKSAGHGQAAPLCSRQVDEPASIQIPQNADHERIQ